MQGASIAWCIIIFLVTKQKYCPRMGMVKTIPLAPISTCYDIYEHKCLCVCVPLCVCACVHLKNILRKHIEYNLKYILY